MIVSIESIQTDGHINISPFVKYYAFSEKRTNARKRGKKYDGDKDKVIKIIRVIARVLYKRKAITMLRLCYKYIIIVISVSVWLSRNLKFSVKMSNS